MQKNAAPQLPALSAPKRIAGSMRVVPIILTWFLLCLGATVKYDTVSVKHKYYTAAFDTVKHYPVIVQWWVSKNIFTCTNRGDRGSENFAADPTLRKATNISKDYVGSGYDRGHNMPAYDNGCDSTGLMECFYYSNVTPQTPRLNRGDWKELEDYTRDSALILDSIKVWSGSVGQLKKIGQISVPKYCWKVLYLKKRRRYEAYLFQNDTSASSTVQSHRTTTDALYKLTGIKVKR